MDAAIFAGVALDSGFRIDNSEFVSVGSHADLVARHDGHLREQRSGGLPTFGAAADVVIGALAVDRDSDLLVGTVTEQRAAREVCRRGFCALINRRMNWNRGSHD
jgi:hypothetical protein